MPDTAPEARVRAGGANSYRLSAPEKIRFFVGPFASTPVETEFPVHAPLEPADFTPALHHEAVDLLAFTGIRPPGAGLLVVRLYPGGSPRDEQVVLSIENEDGELEDCFTATVGEHAHEPDESGCVDFAFLLVFGDPVEVSAGAPFDGLALVDVSTGSWESCPRELIVRGGSWGERRLPVHQFNLEIERF